MTSIFPQSLTPVDRSSQSTADTAARKTIRSEPFQIVSSDTTRDNRFPKTPNGIDGYRFPKGVNGDTAALHFAADPQHHDRYDAVFLAKQDIGPLGAKALFHSLVQSQRLQHLILSQNPAFAPGAAGSQFAMAALADLLKVNHFIGWLVLNQTGITSAAAKVLASGLRKNKGVRHLILADNDIDDEGAAAIADMLRDNTSIESLFLQGNRRLGQHGVIAIANALSSHPGLRKLDLRDIAPLSRETVAYVEDKCREIGCILQISVS